ncbi:MAG: O-antigen ligase family protein [Candidatus Nealsonbacteria bacterium]|nr:O-antigen ligase family protein [Candidatus Nealsonbacteria bacterium]
MLALRKPAWGVALYMLTFFACPPYWWWGESLGDYRWNLYGGVILLVAVLLSRLSAEDDGGEKSRGQRWVIWTSIAILANATLVHFLLAADHEVSADSYTLLAKFVLLFLLIVAATRTLADLRIILLAIVLGAGYIGYEATINDRGQLSGGRLEGIGAAGVDDANGCASLMVTVLPIAGVLFLTGRRWEKLLMLPVAPFIINVILLCNSRGAFLAAIASAVVFLSVVPPPARKQAIKLLALGAVAVWLLLGDPRIIERFTTTFASEEDRDSSAAGRIEFWKSGLAMVADHPFGAGGDGFKKVHGPEYLARRDVHEARAIHNGYINEACEWGIQGLILRLCFVAGAAVLVWYTIRSCRKRDATDGMLLGAAVLASMAAFLVTCLFGDRLDSEWGYWVPALAVGFARLFDRAAYQVDDLPEEMEEDLLPDEEELQSLPV